MLSLPAERPFCERLNKYGGYTSNCRGTMSFKPHMDHIDNPGMIPVLRDAYSSTTAHCDFRPSTIKSGKEKYCRGIVLNESGFTHNRVATADFNSIERAQKEKVNAGYQPKSQLSPSCLAPQPMLSETREMFSPELLYYGRPRPSIDRIIGDMNSGFTRNTQPNPTDGRVLDPVYLGQFPCMARFGPSVTHLDFTRDAVRTGSEPLEPFSRKTDKESGYSKGESGLTPCYLRGTIKNYCKPHLHYATSYRCHYPVRSCNKDYTGFTLTGKRLTQQGIDPNVNLFNGKGYYVSETMERFVNPEKARVQLYPTAVNAGHNPGIFPKPSICKVRPECPDIQKICSCDIKLSAPNIRSGCMSG